ncbi:ankyrin repeat-containing domain protein [Phakopsora pachyrhizi]|nr:ankyrin repeat-containing domain protein [Phakopsora pachyrhizi]
MSLASSSSSHSRRRHPGHSEPPPVTYQDDTAPSARLNRAILTSNLQSVRRLLDQNRTQSTGTVLDPRNPDPVTRKTSLILATETADLEMFKLLLRDYEVEKDSISRDIDNNTVLHIAAAQGFDEIINLYQSYYPHVLDWANSSGMTALHVASQKGHESTVSLLLDLQADVELTDNDGNTALHYAAGWGHLKIVLLLIDRGSPFWAKNNQTFTASDYAFSLVYTHPTNSIATARTVSHLISKDLEAIQDFRARSCSLASTANGNNSPSSTNQTSTTSESPTTSSTNRLLPLQLVNNNSSSSISNINNSTSSTSIGNNSSNVTNPTTTLSNPSGAQSYRSRSRSSTGNLSKIFTSTTTGDGRNRAASTESDYSLLSSPAPREGLSRLRYIKTNSSSSSNVVMNNSQSLNMNPLTNRSTTSFQGGQSNGSNSSTGYH